MKKIASYFNLSTESNAKKGENGKNGVKREGRDHSFHSSKPTHEEA